MKNEEKNIIPPPLFHVHYSISEYAIVFFKDE